VAVSEAQLTSFTDQNETTNIAALFLNQDDHEPINSDSTLHTTRKIISIIIEIDKHYM
jgi:hypothetical protein